MANQHIKSRLDGMQQMLMAAYKSSISLSNASKGYERESFVNGFLAEILTPQFRFGTGDITDVGGSRSGQLDIVIEYPFVPSLPLVAGRSPRLYLAEGVVAVVEVKSDISSQWDQVIKTAKSVANLKRNYGSGVSIGPRAIEKVPFYAVGYKGWSNLDHVCAKLSETPDVNGVLVIESGNFCGKYTYKDADDNPVIFSRSSKGSSMALWELITCIHHAGSMVTSTTKEVPSLYS